MSEREAIPGDIAAALERLADADIRQSAALDKVAAAMDRLSDEIERTYVRRELHDEQMKNLREDLNSQAESIKWANRLAVGSLVTVIVAFVIAFGSLP